MCFSAPASYSTAIILAITGALTISKVKNLNQIFLALIPWIFSLQQLAEGIIWTVSKTPESFVENSRFPALFFLSIALLIWPVWIPISILAIEPEGGRRFILKILFALGIGFDLFILTNAARQWPLNNISVQGIEYHIVYLLPISLTAAIVYCITTLIPQCISSYPPVPLLGAANGIGFFVAMLFFKIGFVSIWCFFAACVSIGIYFIFKKNIFKENYV